MVKIHAGAPVSDTKSGRLSALVHQAWARARKAPVPYKLGEVVVGDDPFNGRREGVITGINGTFVGLETSGHVYFYDYRQLRRPD